MIQRASKSFCRILRSCVATYAILVCVPSTSAAQLQNADQVELLAQGETLNLKYGDGRILPYKTLETDATYRYRVFRITNVGAGVSGIAPGTYVWDAGFAVAPPEGQRLAPGRFVPRLVKKVVVQPPKIPAPVVPEPVGPFEMHVIAYSFCVKCGTFATSWKNAGIQLTYHKYLQDGDKWRLGVYDQASKKYVHRAPKGPEIPWYVGAESPFIVWKDSKGNLFGRAGLLSTEGGENEVEVVKSGKIPKSARYIPPKPAR